MSAVRDTFKGILHLFGKKVMDIIEGTRYHKSYFQEKSIGYLSFFLTNNQITFALHLSIIF